MSKFHPIQLDKLEAVAVAATSGPWSEDGGNIFDDPTEQELDEYVNALLDGTSPDCGDANQPLRPNPFVATTTQDSVNFAANADFIATFNPHTCLRLIAWIRELERREYRKAEPT